MNRIDKKFRELKREGRVALIPYVMAGYPTLRASERMVKTLARAGADLIEIGIPYSDPLADGVTIQKASEVALSRGVTTDDVFELAGRIRRYSGIPLILMTYYNIIFRFGLESFARKAAASGVDGVISPDLPPEEGVIWQEIGQEYGLNTIFLLAPTSTDERIDRVVSQSQGFIYCVSLTGVTGARQKLPINLAQFLAKVRSKTNKPLVVGFGISTAKQAREVAKLSDGVIIGSALLNQLEIEKNEADKIKSVAAFIKGVRKVLHANQRLD